MRTSLAVDELTILRAPVAEDRYGDDAPDWDAAVETVLPGWRIDPDDGLEQIDATRDAVVIRLRALGPLDADVRATDRVRAQGETFEIDGEPLRYRSPRGRVGHTALVLKRVQG